MSLEPFEELDLCKVLLVALCSLFSAVDTSVDHFNIGEDELEVDSLDVAEGIDAAVNVDYVGILEAAYNVNDSVYLAYIGKELVSETFAL